MKRFSEILRLQGMLDRICSMQISNSVWVGIGFNGIVFAFLGVNLWYRFWTIFDFSRFVGGLFIFLGLCSLGVILFPRFLRAFLFLFGAYFFLFGFRGYDVQSQVFETIVAFMAVTLFLVNLRKGVEQGNPSEMRSAVINEFHPDGIDAKNEFHWAGGVNRQLVGLMLCYVGLSVLSLMLLPVGHMLKDFWLFGLKSSFLQVANATPNTCQYPLAGMNRLLLFFVFALEVSRGREARELFKWIFVGIFTGGVFCAFVGLLDYYGVISLRWYSRTVTGYALSSTFLNRSWLAEFILMMAPFVLIGFMSKIKGVWRKILLFGSLVVCEIALILAGARGGWVSYPLILFICWLFFYFSKEGRFESFHFRWKSLIKVAVSVPITIIISSLLIFWAFMPLSDYLRDRKSSRAPSMTSKDTSQYIMRQAARIVEPSGRLRAWTQGLDVGRERPLFGMGYESHCWHANILSDISESYYTVNKDNKHKKILDTPHNIYFQLFVSGGLVGLCLWTIIILYAMTILIIDLIKNQRLLNIPVIISIISFHIYGIFQSMQYIPMIWMFIFLNLGYAMTLDGKVLPERLKRITGVVVKVMIIIVLIGGVVYFVGRGSQGLAEKYGLRVYAKDQDWHKYLGFYHREKGPSGHFRWSGKRGLIKMLGDGLVEIRLECHTPGVDKDPVTVGIRVDDEPVDRLVFERIGAREWQYWLNKKDQGSHEILIDVSRTWNPKKMGISADVRDLGVAVSEPRVLEKMPKDGIGFYGWEMLDAQSAEHKAQSGVGRERRTEDGGQRTEDRRTERFRWTGMRASQSIGQSAERKAESANYGSGDGWVVFLRCAHPNIGKEAVLVRILGNRKVIREERFEDHGWKKVEFKGDELEGVEVVTFQVSRTWNPKLMGISADDRDLGVAVATNGHE